MPKIGEEVKAPNGPANVIVGHRIKETVTVRYEDEQVSELPLAHLERVAAPRG